MNGRMLDSEVPVLPSTSKLTINSLPDDAIYSILKQIKSPNEVQKLKGVSKRLGRIIHSRGYGLARPKIDSMIISFDFPLIPQQQIGKLRCSTFTTPTLLTSINSLDSLRIQATPYQPNYSISNKTLCHWMSPSSATSLPTTIDLINCQTCLSPLNLSTFLHFTYRSLKQSAKQVSYNFGFIQAHPFDVKQFFILNNGFERNFSSLNNASASIQFKSSLINRYDGFETPELAFFMSFLKSKPSLKQSNFEINFILNCESLQTIEPKTMEKLNKFSNIENKLKIISY
uniref:F-box domain-containing protein n=1 Tax=Panagrolaimus sp. ES5 TaxID=591445 RepID=A0AC34FPV0_9BILA